MNPLIKVDQNSNPNFGNATLKGEVCSVKSGYGFIKRLDVDKETFFHASQEWIFKVKITFF